MREIRLEILNLFSRWLRGHRSEAVSRLSLEYRTLLEEEFQLSFECLDALLKHARNYFRRVHHSRIPHKKVMFY